MSYDMTTATSAYIFHGNYTADAYITIGVYDALQSPYTLIWQSEPTLPTHTGQTLLKASTDITKTVKHAIEPYGLYYATIRLKKGNQVNDLLGINIGDLRSTGAIDPIVGETVQTDDVELPKTIMKLGEIGFGENYKVYIGFRGTLENA